MARNDVFKLLGYGSRFFEIQDCQDFLGWPGIKQTRVDVWG